MKKFVAVLGMIAAGGLMTMTSGESRAAGAGVKVGSLVCDVSGGIGLIIGSSKSVRCTYNRASDGREEIYSGAISKFGLDVGVTKKMVYRGGCA